MKIADLPKALPSAHSLQPERYDTQFTLKGGLVTPFCERIVQFPSAPRPGRPRMETTRLDDGDGVSMGSSGIGGDDGFMNAMTSEHIRDADPIVQVTSDPMVQQGRKEVKTDNVSAKDLAKQMEAQREQIDEKVEEGRPFM